MAKLVSKVYGDALFESVLEDAPKSAQKPAGVERLYTDIQTLKTLLSENPELLEILRHPDIAKEEKEGVLLRVFESWMMPELYGLLKLLVEKERISEIGQILDYVSERYKAYMNIGVVYVTSPTELHAGQKKVIEDKILETTSYASLEMHYQTDPSLIGGLVIRIGDRVVDSSVKTRLEKMTRQLKNIQIK